MALVFENYVPRRQMFMYDGTNSADIIAFQWATPITFIAEEEGVLKLRDESSQDEYVIPEGDYILVVNGNAFGGYLPPSEVQTCWTKVAEVA